MTDFRGFSLSRENVKKAFRHPALISTMLAGKSCEVVSRHLQIETDNIAKAKFSFNKPYGGLLEWAARTAGGYCYTNAFLYPICLTMKPRAVLETGVCTGTSSAFILKAMETNNAGQLNSIDLPNITYMAKDSSYLHTDAIPENEQPGFAIPKDLKKRWILTLGDTKKLLPQILDNFGHVDIFFHDSEHSYETMMFEYQTAWPYIRKGGLLISDDVSWSKAFEDFAKQKSVEFQIYKQKGLIIKK
jgi:hypothetical protein